VAPRSPIVDGALHPHVALRLMGNRNTVRSAARPTAPHQSNEASVRTDDSSTNVMTRTRLINASSIPKPNAARQPHADTQIAALRGTSPTLSAIVPMPR